MAVETGVLDMVIKYVIMPIAGIVVGLIGWSAKKLDSRVDELEEKSEELKLKLIKEYYDKEEIKSNIYEPLSTDIKETRSELKALAGMVSDIHSDMAILKFKILGETLDNQNK
jgi:hypothetical protein